jgi:hypothetical protein
VVVVELSEQVLQLAEPEVLVNDPTGQEVQEGEPLGEKLPAEQKLHEVTPKPLKLPAAQAVQELRA